MTTPAFAVNWWQVGWIVANNVIDRVVNLDGQSSNDQYSTYMVSPSIVFNNGTNGGEFYMHPQVSSRVTSFEMHAHRANPVDFGANIVLALSTTSGKRVINKTVGTNQKENSAVHISHSTCPARIMYAYFSKATLENKQFPLDSKRRSEQSIHILNENKRCRLSCFSSYSFHLLQTAVTPTWSCAPCRVSQQACRTPADLRLTDRSMNGEAYAVDSAGLPARVIRRFVLFLWNPT